MGDNITEAERLLATIMAGRSRVRDLGSGAVRAAIGLEDPFASQDSRSYRQESRKDFPHATLSPRLPCG